MVYARRLLAVPALLSSVLFISGCPPNPGGTLPGSGGSPNPPGVNPVIQLGAPPPDTTNNGISIAAGDVNRSNIPSNISIRLIATAADPNLNITSISAVSNLTWQCSSGHKSEIIGVPQNAPLAFAPAITTLPNSKVQNIDSVVNPIAMTGCSTEKPGWGPVNISGFVRVTATNSAGATGTSNTFTFDYANVGSL